MNTPATLLLLLIAAGAQNECDEKADDDRIASDKLVPRINSSRIDSITPWAPSGFTNEDNTLVSKLPLDRPFNG